MSDVNHRKVVEPRGCPIPGACSALEPTEEGDDFSPAKHCVRRGGPCPVPKECDNARCCYYEDATPSEPPSADDERSPLDRLRVFGDTNHTRHAADVKLMLRAYNSVHTDLAALRAQNEALQQDARRLTWLEHRLHSADFNYGEPPASVITFAWPPHVRIGVNLRAAIDAALQDEQAAGANDGK